MSILVIVSLFCYPPMTFEYLWGSEKYLCELFSQIFVFLSPVLCTVLHTHPPIPDYAQNPSVQDMWIPEQCMLLHIVIPFIHIEVFKYSLFFQVLHSPVSPCLLFSVISYGLLPRDIQWSVNPDRNIFLSLFSSSQCWRKNPMKSLIKKQWRQL